MAVKYSVVPARLEDVFVVASHMREADRKEVWASNRIRPLEALKLSLKHSTVCRAGKADDDILCMFGVVPHTLVSNHAAIWMLSTDFLPKHAVKFLRECNNEITSISDCYDMVENWVDTRNSIAIKWLKWLGFVIEEAKPYGIYELPFHHFYKEVNGCQKSLSNAKA